MSSLKDRIELLEDDLKAVPPRISVYHDLPFAILRYDPSEEWELAAGGQAAGDSAGRRGQGSPHHPDVGVPLEGHRGDARAWMPSSSWSESVATLPPRSR